MMATPIIQQLPDDLLCTIFYATLDEEVDVFRFSRGPWLLTRVCRRWREIAINYASLWSKVYIGPIPKGFDFEGAKNVLQTYLEQSRACPLEVSLSVLDGEQTYSLVPLLLSSSSRWQTAKISAVTHDALFNTAIFSALDALSIHARLLTRIWNSEAFAKSFPRLQDLEIYGIIDGLFPRALAVEISSLTTLSLHTFRSTAFIIPFSSIAVNSIQTLTLTRIKLIGTPLTFPSVHTATFTMPYSLEGLTLPSLRDISLQNPKNPEVPFPVDLFTRFLARSSCNIQTFRVTGKFIDLETALAQVPGVQHLDLTGWLGPSHNTKKAHFISSLHRSLLPSLQKLSVSLQHEHMVPFVFDLAQARCRGAAPSLSVLTGVDVHHTKRLDDTALDRVETIRAAGVDVQLHKQSVVGLRMETRQLCR